MRIFFTVRGKIQHISALLKYTRVLPIPRGAAPSPAGCKHARTRLVKLRFAYHFAGCLCPWMFEAFRRLPAAYIFYSSLTGHDTPGRRSPFRTWPYNPPSASTQQQPAGFTCRLPILSLLHCSLFFFFLFFLLLSSFSLFLTPSSSLSHNQKSNFFYTLSATPAAVFFSALCCLYFCIFHQGNRQSAAARRAMEREQKFSSTQHC